MTNGVRTAPSHSLVLIMDETVGQIPSSMNRALVSANSTCVAVGTFSEADGETTISIGEETTRVEPGMDLAFDGVLQTPTRLLTVCTVTGTSLLKYPVGSERTQVQVWVSHPSEPDKILVLVL